MPRDEGFTSQIAAAARALQEQAEWRARMYKGKATADEKLYEEAKQRLAEQQALVGELTAALEELVHEYVANLGTPHEFAICKSSSRDLPGYWQRAKKALAADAAKAALERRTAEHNLIDTAIQYSQALPNDPSILDGSLRRALEQAVVAYEALTAEGKEGGCE